MVWLSRDLVMAIHDEQLAEHDGAGGSRDNGLLEGALARPTNREGYTNPDIAELAALYALRIVRNHSFIDGNRGTAYVALETFLALNRLRFPVSDADAAIVTLQMAAGDIDDDTVIGWARTNVSA